MIMNLESHLKLPKPIILKDAEINENWAGKTSTPRPIPRRVIEELKKPSQGQERCQNPQAFDLSHQLKKRIKMIHRRKHVVRTYDLPQEPSRNEVESLKDPRFNRSSHYNLRNNSNSINQKSPSEKVRERCSSRSQSLAALKSPMWCKKCFKMIALMPSSPPQICKKCHIPLQNVENLLFTYYSK
ncbi:unnamed protein product [Moneuplotes crassus]|uniref:Uncharacterized protein n=1 Tax=Euplotes crassus TaxID=5936 RepID=A0AAD1XAG0_EUPCR|nr:unnamed protein product [Moneuplotes crassus]